MATDDEAEDTPVNEYICVCSNHFVDNNYEASECFNNGVFTQ